MSLRNFFIGVVFGLLVGILATPDNWPVFQRAVAIFTWLAFGMIILPQLLPNRGDK